MAEADNDYYAAKAATEAGIAALAQGQQVRLYLRGDGEEIVVQGLKFDRFVIEVAVSGNQTFYVPHGALGAIATRAPGK